MSSIWWGRRAAAAVVGTGQYRAPVVSADVSYPVLSHWLAGHTHSRALGSVLALLVTWSAAADTLQRLHPIERPML